jgi:tetratricopeptide (TPR) repeat protein/tRNA A-37 threonylcarbamoyl transferase component Bud32
VEVPPGASGTTIPANAKTRVDLSPETDFGPFRILHEIGRGGMGVVYRARETALNRDVALKILLAGERATAEQASRFLREARSAGHLSHPNIVPVFAAGSERGVPYFAMEFIEGASLEDIAREPIEPRRAVEIVRDVARALHYSHLRGIVHRDIKPANILIDREGRPRITDFGLAKVLGDPTGLTVEGTTLGTPAYMSPEQAAGKSDTVGPSSDLYSLGAVFYETLTGRPPFQAETPFHLMAMIQSEAPALPRRLRAGVPRDAERVCLKALEKDPTRRYSGMGEFADDLDRILQGKPVRARPPSALAGLQRFARRQRTALLAALLAFLATGLIGVLFVWRPGSRTEALPPAPATPSPPVEPAVSPEARQAASAKMDRGRSLMDRAEKSILSGDPGRRRDYLEQALKAFGEACAADPGHAEALCEKGRVLALLERSGEALEAFDRALALNPALTDAYYGRVQIRYRRYLQSRLLGGSEPPARLRAQIEEDLDRIERIGAKPEMNHCGRGVLLALDGRTEEALRELDLAVAANESFADAYAAKASVFLAQSLQEGKPRRTQLLEKALEQYAAAIRLSGGAIEHRSGRATVLLALAREKEALEEADALVAAMGDKPYPYLLRAHVRKALGDEKGYDEDMDRADAFPYDDPDIHFAVAGTLLGSAMQAGAWKSLRKRDIDRALRHIDLVLQKRPERTDIRGLRGFANMLAGNPKEAVSDLEAYLREYPDAQMAPFARFALGTLKSGGNLSLESFAANFKAGVERIKAGDDAGAEMLIRQALAAFDSQERKGTGGEIGGVPMNRLAAQARVELARILCRRASLPEASPDEHRSLADAAFEQLEKAEAAGFDDADGIEADAFLAPLRGTLRFEELLEKMRKP